MSTEFLKTMANQLKTDEDIANWSRIDRVLNAVRRNYENGQYKDPSDAEQAFKRMMEKQENC